MAPQSRPTPRAPESATLSVPLEEPSEVKPEEGLDLGVAGGIAGGVEGGVPGGVVGGVVGGMPEAAPPPPAIRVGGAIPEPRKLKHVDPVYPALLKKSRVGGIVILECTISPAGKVADVRVLRGIPMLNDAAVAAVRQWVYTPTLLDGVPIPVIMTVTLSFSVKTSTAVGR